MDPIYEDFATCSRYLIFRVGGGGGSYLSHKTLQKDKFYIHQIFVETDYKQ